jgi:hypothetical protein
MTGTKPPELPWGKYRGRTYTYVAKHDPGYLDWLVCNAGLQVVRERASAALSVIADELLTNERPIGRGGSGKARSALRKQGRSEPHRREYGLPVDGR